MSTQTTTGAVKIKINGREFEAAQGQTILEVAREHGIEIPTFCWHKELRIAANCRMCLVEVAGAPKLLPACQTEIRDGMQVQTESEKVKDWQKRNLEFILLQHPVDCPICDEAGDCRLQDLYYAYDQQKSRLWSYTSKHHKGKRRTLGPHVIYDGERCILCTLCIRFCEEIWGQHILDSRKRGNRREIITAEGETLDFPYSLMTVELCPVGAMTSRDFRFKKRAWFLTRSAGICPGCATGCAAYMEHEGGVVYRLRPKLDPAVNKCWLCDDGVLIGELHNQSRVTEPSVKKGGKRESVDASKALSEAASLLRGRDREKTGVVLSAECTCEENLALMKFAVALDVGERIYVEGRPQGEGDRILRNRDKNPNRAGAEKVARRARLPGREQLVADLKENKLKTLLCLGGEGPAAGDIPADAAVICLAAREGDLARAARVVLPAPSYAEAGGAYVNAKGLVRRFDAAIQPGHGVKTPPQVWETLSRIAESMGSPLPLAADALRSEVGEIVGEEK
jgi:NADH-quinone oxidoreductase subunit G